ncbi:MAG: 2-hydroxyacyl-CoA dehydratase family protein [Dehalococcoidales bacterium]|nr:2-hydroxyacyl-CoA dehydratase family protein [Dehalococcoidales bacterium]MDD5604974.1 2-hydroxyacyl-CoA dehydratase family protein [Dehalococcoidales bacterium]MDX9986776.1 2-hydroxyacyl-CoA dehydratase family protein [Dehalococcoidales bacterium]NLE90201.1 2-hydroxyacyl-CoA dehydratase [Dehalococcoidales bacterium]
MNTYDSILLAPLEERIETDSVRIIQAKAEGKKVVGYFCPHVPEELILAAGMIPVRLAQGGDIEAVTAGEDYLKADSCPYARSCLGFQKQGNPIYSNVDAICVAYTCDSMRKNQEYWAEYLGVPSFPLGITQSHDRLRSKTHALDYFKNELNLLASRLEALSGQNITSSKIKQAIRINNQIREQLWRLFEYPVDKRTPIEWRNVFRIAQAGFTMDRLLYLNELIKFNKQLAKIRPNKSIKDTRPRLMICGSIIAQGDNKVLDIIEQAGGNIVADSICTGSMFARKRVTMFGLAGNPMDALAERYLYNIPCPFMTDLPKRLGRIVKIIRDYNVAGIIYYSLKYCDTWRAEFKAIRDVAQQKLATPTLLIEAEYSPADIGTIKTKVEAFIEMMEGR